MSKNNVLLALLAGAVLVAYWSLSNDEQPIPVSDNVNISPKPPKEAHTAMPAMPYQVPAIKPKKNTSAADTEPEEERWDETAIEQMREARIHGDDRAPPIVHEPVTEQRATPEELASPELYNAYEAREEMKLKAQFVSAAQPQMQELKQQIQAMKDAGLDQAAIREAEEKLIQLDAMTNQLQKQHPEITGQMHSSTQP